MATTATSLQPLARPVAATTSPRVLALTLAGTVFLSAFLLFQVQPLISKAILPWFGGTPAVWTTCILFFQVVLFLGYAYAHALTRFVVPKAQVMLHVVLLLAALLFLPIIPREIFKPENSEHPAARILLLLLLTVGLPYFMLSTTGPLVQAWFARAFQGRSPYRLYALSNVGSLAALLTFPVLFEPALDIGQMAWLWSGAFLLFAALCSISAYLSLVRSPNLPASQQQAAEGKQPTWLLRGVWLLLPAWSSMLLLTTMNYVCQDVAPVPLLFVVPLAIYLLTFIIAFDHPRWYNRALYAPATVVALLLVAGLDEWPAWLGIDLNYIHELIVYFSALFLVCMVCHGELAGMKPAPAHLTEYFLLISLGGALGGLFVSLVAPQIFHTFYEWNIGLLGSFLLACGLTVGSLLSALAGRQLALRWTIAASGLLVASAGAYQIEQWQAWSNSPLYRARNFYGLVSVREYGRDNPRWHNRVFVSGSVKHGRQLQHPERRREPIAYFHPQTGIGRAIEHFRDRSDTRVGVVGMGIATVATYAQPGHYYRFYEINPEVDHIARTYFTFLDDCRGEYEVVLGDARLELERELKQGQPQRFHVLCLDAFSGDSVPAHLLTSEAFELYVRHLQDDGVICFNITNRYLDLSGVVEGLAREHGFQTRRIATESDLDRFHYRTDFILVTRNEDFLVQNPERLPDDAASPFAQPVVWTDRYSNIFSILK